MGRTKKTVTTTTTETPGEPEEPQGTLSDEELERETMVEDFLGRWQTSSGKCVLLRQSRTGELVRCGSYSPEVLTDDLIQEDYPEGGTFTIRVLDKTNKYLAQETVTIAPLPPSKRRTAPGAPAPAGLDPWQQMFITQMQQSMQQNQQLLLAMIQNMGRGGQRESVADMVQAIVALNAATKPATTSTELLKDLLSIVEKVKGGGEDNAYTLLKEALPPLLEKLGGGALMMPAAGAAPALPEVREVSPPAVTTIQAAPPAPVVVPAAAEPPRAKNAYELLKEVITELKDKARRDKDVELWIDLALDRSDEAGYMVLLDAIEKYPFEQLAAYDAEIAGDPKLRVWFEKFYSGVRDELLRSMDPVGAAGNGSDAGSDGGPGE